MGIKVRTELVACWKCKGSGQYLSYGICFACHGSGKVHDTTTTAPWWVRYYRYSALEEKAFASKGSAWAFIQGEWGEDNLCIVLESTPDGMVERYRQLRGTPKHLLEEEAIRLSIEMDAC